MSLFPLGWWGGMLRGMSEMRKGWAVAVAVCVAVLVSGCGGGSDEGGREPEGVVSASMGDPLPEDTDTGAAEEDWMSEEAEQPVEEDEYPDTSASIKFDEKADANGWVTDGYAQASEYVLMMCESMDAWGEGAAETLASNHVPDMTADEKTVLKAGAKPLCARHAAEIGEALGGEVSVRTMSSGTYEIVKDAGLGKEVAPPGTYETSGDLSDCYWERTTEGGDIIDNQFATAARKIRVTVRAGELFTSQGCGTWSLVQ